jgi:hypothetical protein
MIARLSGLDLERYDRHSRTMMGRRVGLLLDLILRAGSDAAGAALTQTIPSEPVGEIDGGFVVPALLFTVRCQAPQAVGTV